MGEGLTKEEAHALMVQVGSRLDELKKEAEQSNDFNRIVELVEHIRPIQSGYNKIMNIALM